ncbi:sugar MFS transporter [Dysgonomonas sp. BGC7]|uniref:sugar MFS transporter n=1 Tax=Dysgonomonas sp. BGC7 TaxID=1658008 RepID=UPI0006818413|nr:sugar MFS transporter [Dysgonomonas sp. BGC7]MBD8387829.1 sugar MFS transporter [Dysgonomonas sp. BGC7]
MNSTKKSLFTGSQGQNYLFPFILVTSLFFLWGFAHALLDVLNAHFQEILQISKARSALVQFALYGGYFVMGIPAGLIIKKYGYKKGIVFGLIVFAIGAFLFYPATLIKTFFPFLIALFVIACGLTCLETAANPYTTVLGPAESGARRINLAQSFNGLGWILGPLVGGMLIFSDEGDPFAALATPYIGIGIVVLLIAALFIRTPLPQISAEDSSQSEVTQTQAKSRYRDLLKHPLFIFAVIAQFFYVAGQTGIGSFFINYVIEVRPDISHLQASQILAFGGMGMFMGGRILGSYIMKFFNPKKLLAIYATMNILLMAVVVMSLGMTSVVCLFASYFFMSIMYPTIFAIGINGLKENTEKGSSLIVMAVAGGALIPMLMGRIADIYSMATGFLIPLVCFIVILLFGLSKLKN